MSKKNIFYAQSGGATAVINASACGLIEEARKIAQKNPEIGTVYAGKNGILGALQEELIDTAVESDSAIERLRYTPACAFGSCRYKLGSLDTHQADYARLIEVFSAHNIRYFFYNGGGDSQDTTLKIAQASQKLGYPLTCIGIPKTIDNDLPYTHNSPGFASVAKYVAISTYEAALDVRSMSANSTQVFILEVMGRHAGWIAAAAGLAKQAEQDAPHLILFPEIAFDLEKFLAKVAESVQKYGYCVIVASEGIQKNSPVFASSQVSLDAFGHQQLGGVAPLLSAYITKHLGYKNHWAVSDYLQRAARHIASAVDVEQAYALGAAGMRFALQGKHAEMLTISVQSTTPEYRWDISSVPLEKVANVEYKMPRNYIDETGFGITAACADYLSPLITGEAYPPYKGGLPDYIKLKNLCIQKKCAPWQAG